jgi:small subunit ribosomal protein S16
MALSIRLTRVGRRKAPAYRIVVAESSKARDGRFVEILGHYQPLREETVLEVKEDRALHWLHIGAQPSDTVRSLLRKKGIMKIWHDQREEKRKALKSGSEKSE